eukprot:TRINITY_DN1225_c0_g1_i1.p1 TRINITY_DN1225_c0_g1~~TRINITY_DN1225_c0_g1_i1.p1  ORF type:complete len:537 (+),score=103.91 TRINITY_DN1225_c0_g1_i1:153-1613(+)
MVVRKVNLAPVVLDELRVPVVVDHTKTHIYSNPTYEELWRPEQGPQAPWATCSIVPGQRNTLNGFVEDTGVNDWAFDEQHNLFSSLGYALNPDSNSEYVFRQKEKKRKKEEVLETETTEKEEGNEDGQNKKQKIETEEDDINEDAANDKNLPTSEIHIDAAPDYQGRTWIDPPTHLKPNEHVCYTPKKKVHTWTGHSKGVSTIRFFPRFGHLLLSGSMDTTIKIWEVNGKRRCIQTYTAHNQAVKALEFTHDGKHFLSCAYDRYARVWDTETGKCIRASTKRKVPYCCKWYPEDEHIFLVGQADKKVLQWDVRTGCVVQEYDRHLGAINTITFVDENRRFVTTSDDKSIRVWEYGIGVEIKYIAEPHMHSIPSVTRTVDNKWLLCQSLDNKILVYSTRDKFRQNRKKTFRGHTTAGYACEVVDSPDGRWVMSGTSDGGLWFWDWKTTKILKRIQAHSAVTIGCQWHPIEPSKCATCSWDGTIKYWD